MLQTTAAALVLVDAIHFPMIRNSLYKAKAYLFPCGTGDMGHAILSGNRNKGIQLLVPVRCCKN